MAPTDDAASGRSPLAGYATRELHGHKKRVSCLTWSSSGRKLASGAYDNNIRVWTVDHSCQGKPERADVELKGHSSTVCHASWKHNSESILATTTSETKGDKSLRIWDTRQAKHTWIRNNQNGLFVTWSLDGIYLATINKDNILNVLDSRKPELVVKSKQFNQEINEIQWGPTNQQFMMATQSGTVDVLAMPSLEHMWSLRSHFTTTYGFACDRQYKYMATCGADAIVSVWDIRQVACMRTWAHLDQPARVVSMSGDAQFIAYGGAASELEVLSVDTGARLADIRLRSHFSDSVAWCPTANVLAYCDEAPIDPRDHRLAMVGVVGIYAPPKQQ